VDGEAFGKKFCVRCMGRLEEILAMEGEREDKACTKPFDARIKSLRASQPAKIFYCGFEILMLTVRKKSISHRLFLKI